MKTNDLGITLIKSLEGCRLTAYKLKGERNYTIGYGHSDANIKKGDTITQPQADNYLKSDLEKFEKYVTRNTKFGLNENQFSALVSYTYNRGYKGFKELMDNTSTIEQLPDNIVKYWGSNKNYKDVLVSRRKKERFLFITPVTCTMSQRILLKSDIRQPIPIPTLKRGSMGVSVDRLQECLNKFGYGLKIDGKFGDCTYKALCDFQYRNGLRIDGIYGNHTRDKMRELLWK